MATECLETTSENTPSLLGRLPSGTNHFNRITAEHPRVVKSAGKLVPGDVLWVHVRGYLWWPAQVVDQNMVSKSSRPQKKNSSEVLVRLYGTYTYLYRDPWKQLSEFEKILEQNNGSYRETFEKALEHDISQKKPRTPKRSAAEPTAAEAGNETPKAKKSKKDASTVDRHNSKSQVSVTPSAKASSESSGRRIKVMQNLGLVAPNGSPFRKNRG